jgi:HK97 family phage major capsid protein
MFADKQTQISRRGHEMSLSNLAILEITELQDKAERLSRGSASDRSQAAVLLRRIKSIHETRLSSDEMRAKKALGLYAGTKPKDRSAEYRDLFDKYITGKIESDGVEFRDFMAGQQSILYTSGPQGGYVVPTDYDDVLREANQQVDQILDPTVVDFSMTGGPFLQAQQLSAYNLATAAAQLVGETVQQTPMVIPTVAGATLKNNLIFKATFAASIEAEQDIPDFASKIVRASAVALARTVSQKVLIGRGGSTDINGITNLVSSSYTNGTAGKITLTDILAIYFAVNRWYRSQPKCGWLVSDNVWKLLRAATDSNGRPLLDVVDDQEMLLGKPVYNCPSLGIAYLSLGLTGAILFGDLSHVVVHASRPTVQRTVQQGTGDVTRGESIYVARMRADATLFDPSNGSYPPIVLATIN